jgi:hypothetical protein
MPKMTTKEAAKKVRALVEANRALMFRIERLEDIDAHLPLSVDEIKAALPEAEKAVEKLSHRFP